MTPWRWIRVNPLAVGYVILQIVGFFAFVVAGRILVPELGRGEMDWIVTAAYGQVMLAALLVTAAKRHWTIHTCVQALAFVYVANVVISYYDPGFIAQGPWLLFWPITWACLVVHEHRMALLTVPAVASAAFLYVEFGLRIDAAENAYWHQVVNNLLHQLPLLYAGAWALTRTYHVTSAEPLADREHQEKKAA